MAKKLPLSAKRFTFNMWMRPAERQKLDALAALHNVSAAEMIRNYVEREYDVAVSQTLAKMRDPFEYDLSTATRFERHLYTPGTYENPSKPGVNPPYRLAIVYDEEFGEVEIAEEETTSERKTAKVVTSPANEVVTCTVEQARWLYKALGDLLKRVP